jgi:hypothetical protein
VFTALGDYVDLGKSPASPLSKIQSFTLDRQLIGFFGTDSNRVLSLGFVGVDATCLVNVDPATIKSAIIPVASPKTETKAPTKPSETPVTPTPKPTSTPKPDATTTT